VGRAARERLAALAQAVNAAPAIVPAVNSLIRIKTGKKEASHLTHVEALNVRWWGASSGARLLWSWGCFAGGPLLDTALSSDAGGRLKKV
jgi:hypothetical protein